MSDSWWRNPNEPRPIKEATSRSAEYKSIGVVVAIVVVVLALWLALSGSNSSPYTCPDAGAPMTGQGDC